MCFSQESSFLSKLDLGLITGLRTNNRVGTPWGGSQTASKAASPAVIIIASVLGKLRHSVRCLVKG